MKAKKKTRAIYQFRVLSHDRKPLMATNDEGEARRYWANQPYGARFQKRVGKKWEYDPK